ncbi:MAG TPA: hypothetical protein PK246_02200 [Saprospiraceae bacterium]|nr:hypothetical protein [Saprospiraceae bacterium]
MLDLNSDELLSTLIMAIIDTEKAVAEFAIAGDGIINLNGQLIEYDNDNKPDYVGYYLNIDKRLWFQNKTEKLSATGIIDLSIATDGIFTFKNFDGKLYPNITQEEIMYRFFVDRSDLENSNKLKKKLIDINNIYGQKPSDDLTMIRVMFE